MSEQEDSSKEQSSGGLVSRSIDEFVGQLQRFTERARGLAGAAVPSFPRLPTPPGMMSASQLRAIDRAVRGQRQQIQGLVAQLQAFDEQLGVFERILEPLVEWSSTWARLEESVADFVRRDPGDDEVETPPAPPPSPPARRRRVPGRR